MMSGLADEDGTSPCRLHLWIFFFLFLFSFPSPPPLPAAPSDVPPNAAALALSRSPLTSTRVRLELMVAYLLRDDVEATHRVLSDLPESPRRDYLLRQLAGAYGALDEAGKRLAPSSPMGRATGFHNLFLFLRGAGVSADLARSHGERGIASYRQMIEKETVAAKDRAFARGACAALLHEIGELQASRGLRKEFDPRLVPADDRNLLLAYMDATFGDREGALSHIRASLARNHRATVFWLHLSDDFYRLADDRHFRALLDRATRQAAFEESREGARP